MNQIITCINIMIPIIFSFYKTKCSITLQTGLRTNEYNQHYQHSSQFSWREILLHFSMIYLFSSYTKSEAEQMTNHIQFSYCILAFINHSVVTGNHDKIKIRYSEYWKLCTQSFTPYWKVWFWCPIWYELHIDDTRYRYWATGYCQLSTILVLILCFLFALLSNCLWA